MTIKINSAYRIHNILNAVASSRDNFVTHDVRGGTQI